MKSPLSKSDQQDAYILYQQWFRKYPDIKNPTDLNRVEKYDWCVSIGWRHFNLMQRARKSNVKQHDYPHPWTKPGYWKEDEK